MAEVILEFIFTINIYIYLSFIASAVVFVAGLIALFVAFKYKNKQVLVYNKAKSCSKLLFALSLGLGAFWALFKIAMVVSHIILFF